MPAPQAEPKAEAEVQVDHSLAKGAPDTFVAAAAAAAASAARHGVTAEDAQPPHIRGRPSKVPLARPGGGGVG